MKKERALQEELKKDREKAVKELMEKDVYIAMAKEIIKKDLLPVLEKAHGEDRLKEKLKLHIIAYEKDYVMITEPRIPGLIKEENKYPGNEISNLPVWRSVVKLGKEYGIESDTDEPVKALGGEIYNFYMNI